MRNLVSVLIVGLIFAASQTANATPITFNFTGTATFQNGIYVGQGSAVTGFYTFDTSLVDSPSVSGDAGVDLFRPDTLGNEGLVFEISLTNGSITRSGPDVEWSFVPWYRVCRCPH